MNTQVGITIQNVKGDDKSKTWYYRKRYAELQQDFEDWKPQFRDVVKNLLTRHGRWLNDDTVDEAIEGGNREQYIITGEPLFALEVCKNGLKNGTTNSAQPWLHYAVDDEELMKQYDVKLWCELESKKTLTLLSNTNFYEAFEPIYKELIGFGNACIIIEEDFDEGVRFIPLTIGEWDFDVDSKNRPIALYRKFTMSVSQMVEKFGYENLSDDAKLDYDNGNLSARFTIYNVIAKNNYRKYENKNKESYAWKSCYFEDAEQDMDKVLLEEFYRTKPFVIFRDGVISNTKWGFGIAMKAMNDILKCYKWMEDFEEAFAKTHRPPLIGDANADMRREDIDDRPSGFTQVKFDAGRPQLSPLYAVDSRLQEMMNAMELHNQKVAKYFYNDMFLAVIGQQREATAYEIARKVEEKNMQLGSIIESLQGSLDEVIDRVFDIELNIGVSPLTPYGLVSEPPEAISGMPLKVKYVGSLAMAQQMTKTAPLMQLTQYALQLAQVDPEGVKTRFNIDGAIKSMAENAGSPVESINSDETVAKINQQKAQSLAAQNMVNSAKPLADAAKTASETMPDGEDGENLLQKMSQRR